MADQTVVPETTQEGDVAVLTNEVSSGGILNGVKMHLFKSSFAPTSQSKLADFTAAECAFTGYAAVVLTWSAVGLSSDDSARSVSNRAFFQATDAVAPDTAGGFWVDAPGTSPTESLMFGIFGEGGIPFTEALAFAAITLVQSAAGPVTADVES